MTRRPILWLLVVLALLGGWLAYDRGRDQVTPTAVAPAGDETALAPASPPATVEAEVAEDAPSAASVAPRAALEADRASERPATEERTEAGATGRAAGPATEERTEARATARAAGEAERVGETPAPTTGAAVVARSSPTTAVAPAPARETPAAEPQLPSTQAAPGAPPAAEPPAAAASEGRDRAAPERERPIEQRAAPDAAPAPDHEQAARGADEERPLEWSQLERIMPGAGPAALPPTATLLDRPQEPPATGSSNAASTAEVGPKMSSEGGDGAPDQDSEQRQAALEVAPAAPEPTTGTAAGGTSRAAPSQEAAEPPEATADDEQGPPAVSLMVDSIKRALAAMLGGPPKVSEMVPADVVDPPKGVPAATETRTPRGPDADAPAAGATEPVRPSFDIVRVERDGRAVIAGRAAPGAEIELRSDDDVIDRVRASARGEWVSAPLEALTPGARELTAVARERAGAPLLEAEQVVVVALPEPPPPQPAEVRAAGPPPPQPAEVAKAGADPVAVLLPKDERGTGRVLQAPGRISSDGQLALLVLDYDQTGQIRLTGEAPPGAPVRIYVDNRPSGEFLVEPDGKWSTLLDRQLPPGDYTLRLDQLGTEGRPVARLETPFTRVRQPPVAGQAQVDYVVVQPGNSLWRIARRLFGEGFKYVHIYDANQAQIRDPDLIYPGQVFEVPAALGTAG